MIRVFWWWNWKRKPFIIVVWEEEMAAQDQEMYRPYHKQSIWYLLTCSTYFSLSVCTYSMWLEFFGVLVVKQEKETVHHYVCEITAVFFWKTTSISQAINLISLNLFNIFYLHYVCTYSMWLEFFDVGETFIMCVREDLMMRSN